MDKLTAEKVYKLSLILGGFSSHQLTDFVKKAGSHKLLWELHAARLQEFILPEQLACFENYRKSHDPIKELEYLNKNTIRIIFKDDPAYPFLLSQIYAPPEALFVKGSLPDADTLAIGVVGTRWPTYYGSHMAERLGKELAHDGVTIVSGMARGIDGAAHKGALMGTDSLNKCATIGVLGTGIDVIYPKEHKELARKIAENGAVISEFPLGSTPLGWHFPKRNRVISGLSHGVVVVEAGEKSGALITANCALNEGREVFALPGRVDLPNSYGTNKLIQNGAKLVHCIKDILEEFPYMAANFSNLTSKNESSLKNKRENLLGREINSSLENKESPLENAGFMNVCKKQPDKVKELSLKKVKELSFKRVEHTKKEKEESLKKEIVSILAQGVDYLPDMLHNIKAAPGKIEGTLLEMELEGTVRRLPGNYYTCC